MSDAVATLAVEVAEAPSPPLDAAAALAPGATGGQTPVRRLSGVANARDLAEACCAIQPGRVFRCASPGRCSAEDVVLLREAMHVLQYIDFREAAESHHDTSWDALLAPMPGGLVPSLRRVPMLDRRQFARGLLPRLSAWTLASAAVYRALGWRDEMQAAVMAEVNAGGLLLLYQVLLDTAQAQLRYVLQLVAAAAAHRQPQAFFCKLGKDRTGLVAALVLTCCGASEEEIVSDYMRSHGQGGMALGGLEQDKDARGLSEAAFSGAEAGTMRQLLAYAHQQWGGLRGYMARIGFSAGQQEALRHSLTSGDWG